MVLNAGAPAQKGGVIYFVLFNDSTQKFGSWPESPPPGSVPTILVGLPFPPRLWNRYFLDPSSRIIH